MQRGALCVRDTGALSLARAHTQIHSSQTERKAKRRAQPLRGGEREGPGKALAEKSQSGEHHQPEVVFPPISQYHPNLKKGEKRALERRRGERERKRASGRATLPDYLDRRALKVLGKSLGLWRRDAMIFIFLFFTWVSQP